MAIGAPAGAAVMISQVYGGGGNSGAPLNNDFVELHNSGTAPVNMTGWSVQYASSAGSSWGGNQLTVLSGSIPARGYYLVQLGSGANTPAPLPTPDVVGITAMSATAGKVALVNNATALSGTCPVGGATVVDFVGFGTAANCSETAPAPAPSNTLAVIRASAGDSCQDSGNNSADFAALAPLPRNSAAAPQSCRDGSVGPIATLARLFEIQGSGAQSPLVGKLVTTSGVVTKLNNNGFFIQDLTGDGNDATSDGIFVFASPGNFPAVAVGNLVGLTATVTEFNTGATPNAQTPTPTLTELTSVSTVALLGTGYMLAPRIVNLPESVEGELERYEGMLVTLNGPFVVGQNFFQGRYGQLTLAVAGRLETPTNRHRPGSPQALALADENARRRILLDDGSSQQNPNPTPYLDLASAQPRAGDSVRSVTGVIDFGLATNSNPGLGDYKIHPTVAPVFTITNPRTAAPAVGGNLKVASFNVLNFFTTFTDGRTADGQTGQGCALGSSVSASNCRGANNAAEFERQRAKIVAAMAALDADVLGLMEIQNNGNVAAQNLVDALNARVGAGSYVTAALPAQGTGTDAIRVAIIYKPAKVVPVGAPFSDTDPVNNRPTLAQTFSRSGERFTLVVNHLKSKGSCPQAGDPDAAGNTDIGDGQGCWNAQRLQ
jgi:predicted extracellular nuclease